MYLDLMNQWFIIKCNGINLSQFFEEKDIRRIAVYGMGMYGRHVIRELENSQTIVSFAIDRIVEEPYKGIQVYKRWNDQYINADAIINTVITQSSVIRKDLDEVTDLPVYNLDDVVYELSAIL